MQQNKLSFESENLVVDYLTLNLKNGKDNIRKIAQFFNRYHRFNCYSCDEKIGFKSKKPYLDLVNSRYKLEMVFAFNSNPVNRNTVLIQFSGLNAHHFYRILKTQEFNWEIFDLNDLSLGRFDISYIRSNQTIQKSNLLLFYQRSADKFKKRYPNSIPGVIDTTLGLGTRTGDSFLRVYLPDDDSLKFELEIKKYKAKQMTPFLIHNSFVEFEKSIVESFFRYLKIALVFDTCYTDWLIHYSRKTDKPMNSLVTSYLENRSFDSLAQQKQFFKLLQFLSFSRGKPFFLEYIRKQTYYVVEFKISEFMNFMKIENKSYYQIKKVKEFLQSLQEETPFVKIFTEKSFRSVASFPYVELEIQHKSLVGRVAIAKELYLYDYPFSFPSSFLSYQTNHELQVKLQLIQVMSTNSLEKVFDVKPFLDQFNVSTQKKAYIKKLIVQSFDQLKEHNCIENQFQLITKSGITQKIDKLIPLRIGQSKTICFYEKL